MESLHFDTFVPQQNWRIAIWTLLVGLVAYVMVQASWRPSLPKNAPKLLSEGYPILGAVRFFSDRRNFALHGRYSTETGNFTFRFGKHLIVGLSGVDGRKTFFQSRELNMSEGYAVLFTTTPSVPGHDDKSSFDKFFSRTITAMMKKENFVKNLPMLVGDTKAALQRAVARGGGTTSGVMDPFDDVYRIVYLLTMRTVGANELARSPELLEKTLGLFEIVEQSSSPARIIFPWLPTPAHIRKMIAGGRLYMIFSKLVEERRETGHREDDALQFLIDSGADMIHILSFVLGALFAGQLNSGINAAWMFVYLASNTDWYARVRAEVDAAVEKHRKSPDQSSLDVLASLSIDDWEADFPLIDLCLRECIRFQLVGTAFRKNISGKDVSIGDGGEVVPKDAFAVYLLDDIHFDPEVYTDPYKWDPGRYLPDRAEDKKAPLGYLGWGVGRHPCLGMRFAKLEMSIIGATFTAMFDYSLVDPQGNPVRHVPPTNRDNHAASKPDVPLRLKYQIREGAI